MSKTLCYCLLAIPSLPSGRKTSIYVQEPFSNLPSRSPTSPPTQPRSVSHSFASRRRSEMLDGGPFLAGVTLLVSLWVYRDPGHFVGKGWMKLEFDRLILPDNGVSVSTKVQSAGKLRWTLRGESTVMATRH